MKASIGLIQAALVIVLILCAFNVVTVFQGFIREEGLKMEMQENVDGGFEFKLSAEPMNRGFMAANIDLSLGILSLSNETLAENHTSLSVRPGSSEAFTMLLSVPGRLVEEHQLKHSGGYMKVKVDVSTLGGLFRVSNVLKVGGEGGF